MQFIEDMIPGVKYNGLNTQNGLSEGHNVKAAVNATATLTATQVELGYITCKSTSAVTMTMPTGTLLGNYIGATQGTTFELYIDNTASSSSGTVTVAVSTNAILSDMAATTAGSAGQLTITYGVTGIGRFTIMFTSPTAYVFTRTA
jgi:hypothetical protein